MISNVTQWNRKLRDLLRQQGFKVSEMASVDGVPIYGYFRSSSAPNAPVIYASSGIHGDEPAGPLAIAQLADSELFTESFTWMVCPLLNPQGHAVGTRENGQKVDLNRDYFTQKSVEVAGHVKWLCDQPVPDLMVSLHEDWETTGYYFYEINTKGDDEDKSRRLMKRLDQIMPREPSQLIDDHLVREPGWIFHDAVADEFECWPEAIYMANSRGCPLSLTIETPSSFILEDRVRLQAECVEAAVSIWFVQA